MSSPGATSSHLGIRYATAERFERPVLVPFDASAMNGTGPGSMSPQLPGTLEHLLGVDTTVASEDCLFLNVFTPSDVTADSLLPVLYWIHGGAYTSGAGSMPWYDGSRLAARGHVVVTINYRLGAFGFLGGNNWGTLDQICGLEWVRQNIASFGGDPGNVTIFGESAGGSAVVSLLASPSAAGLFHQAWAMSPSIRQLRTMEQAERWAQVFFGHAGVAGLDDCRALSAEQLIAAQAQTLADYDADYTMFAPTAGGDAMPDDILAAAATNPVPFCVGTNRDENLLFMAFDPKYAGADAAKWVEFTETHFGDRAAEARSAYEAARPGFSPLWLMAAVQTDHTFRRPAQALCEARVAAGNPTWMYWFTWASPAFGGVFGSAHAFDIPFAFDNLHAPGIEMLLGGSTDAQSIATRFADEISSLSAKGAPSWEAFDLDTRATLRLDVDVELLHDPDPGLRVLHA